MVGGRFVREFKYPVVIDCSNGSQCQLAGISAKVASAQLGRSFANLTSGSATGRKKRNADLGVHAVAGHAVVLLMYVILASSMLSLFGFDL